MRRYLIALSAAVLAGCAYQLTLMPRDSGQVYRGEATEDQMGGGTLRVTIDGRLYAGHWVSTSSNDSFTILNTYGRGARGGSFTGTGFGQSYGAGGTGKAMLSSQDGKGLRCEFTSSGYGSGGGVCVDDGGRVYDLMFTYK